MGFESLPRNEMEFTVSKARDDVADPESTATIARLQADPAFAADYLKAAFESISDPDKRANGLLALRYLNEAHGGMAVVAREAGITREALYRALSPNGNPTMRTLLAVLRVVGMRLSVVPKEQAPVET